MTIGLKGLVTLKFVFVYTIMLFSARSASAKNSRDCNMTTRMGNFAVAALFIAATTFAQAEPANFDGEFDAASYPRISEIDLQDLILSRVVDDWDDEKLSLHLHGSGHRPANSFDQREWTNSALADATAKRASIEKWKGVERFSIGAVNLDRQLMVSEPPGILARFHRSSFQKMDDYNEYDFELGSAMRLHAYDFDTLSFRISGSPLPCDATTSLRRRFGAEWHTLAYRLKNWESDPMNPRICRIYVQDEALAREIEELRVKNMLAIGVRLFASISNETEQDALLFKAGRVDVDLYRKTRRGAYKHVYSTSFDSSVHITTDDRGADPHDQARGDR